MQQRLVPKNLERLHKWPQKAQIAQLKNCEKKCSKKASKRHASTKRAQIGSKRPQIGWLQKAHWPPKKTNILPKYTKGCKKCAKPKICTKRSILALKAQTILAPRPPKSRSWLQKAKRFKLDPKDPPNAKKKTKFGPKSRTWEAHAKKCLGRKIFGHSRHTRNVQGVRISPKT